MGFHFAVALVDNFVCLKGFVIESFYNMMVSFVLEEKFVLLVVFVHFVYMVQKDLVDK